MDRFYPGHSPLVRYFRELVGDPRGSDPRRFCWDFWHVPDQYRLLRTPAYHFFPKQLYEPLHQALAQWGRANLGCHDISPPWMSAYIEGCEQQFHADLPHGPWAFVYVLKPPVGRGGETLLLRDEILSFWEQDRLGTDSGLELDHVLERVVPKANRLTVFDPRIPHGVSRVEGARDLLEARVVIHGWFVQPRPFVSGALAAKAPGEREVARLINDVVSGLDSFFRSPENRGASLKGMASLRLEILPSGRIGKLKLLANSLRAPAAWPGLELRVLRWVSGSIRERLTRIPLPALRAGSVITLPLVFD